MSKKYQTVFIIFLGVSLFVSCGKSMPTENQISCIVEEFRNGDYEYVTTWYNVSADNQKRMSSVLEGKVISSPYQQYEEVTDFSDSQGLIKQYWYTKDDEIVYNMKVRDSDYENGFWITNIAEEKGTAIYERDDLTFIFDRTEIIAGKKVYIYDTQYETELHSVVLSPENPEDMKAANPIKLTCVMKLKYYIDFASNEVVRIFIDESDIARANAILSLMSSGKSQAEAEDITAQDRNYDSLEGVIDIKNFGTDIVINIPEDLPK